MQKQTDSTHLRLILASSSQYRKKQLQQLVQPFECIPPDVDESPQVVESAGCLVERLARKKANTIATDHPTAVVIGSDQAAVLDGIVLGKPGSRKKAREQLSRCSGNSVIVETAVAVVCKDQHIEKLARVTTLLKFRELATNEIHRYVEQDNPVDCAGSFKIESAGAALFTRVSSDDPTALVGLPLIATAQFLREIGFALP